MRRMSDEELRKEIAKMARRHAIEWGELVHRACVGRTMAAVAKTLGRHVTWVRAQLDLYVFEQTLGQSVETAATGPGLGKTRTIKAIVTQHNPKEIDSGIVEKYELQGFMPPTAARLALAESAVKDALKKGLVKPSASKKRGATATLMMDPKVEWNLRLRRLCNDVTSAAGALDRANQAHLRSKETLKRVAAAHSAWMEQIARLQNLHPEFNAEGLTYDEKR